MRKIVLAVAILMLVTPAMATVTITCTPTPGTGEVTVEFNNDDGAKKIRAFALTVSLTPNDAKILSASDWHPSYHIHPGSIGIDGGGVVTNWGTPIAEGGPPDANTMTIEKGSLWAPNDPCDFHKTAPPQSGVLFKFVVDKACTVTITKDAGRGGVVMEDSSNPTTSTPLCVTLAFQNYDFGDANDPTYPTLSASNGAKHDIGGGYLGASVDPDADGQPNPTATGDDNDGNDDEDGVVFVPAGKIVKGGNTSVDVTASAAGYLNAWVDFDGNGSWAGEQIFTDQVLAVGQNNLSFAVGCSATSGMTVSRWRYTTYDTSGTLSYEDEATDGEVEDHEVEIVCHVPDIEDMNTADANAAIVAACFNVGDIFYECNDVIADGNVIRSDPAYCNYPACGTDVNYVVSTGPCGPADPNIGTCWDLVNECAGQYAFDAAAAIATGLGGDSDCDGSVNFNDLNALKRSWGGTKGVSPEICDLVTPGVYCCCTDFDHDGTINFNDLNILKATWGNVGYSPATLEQSCPP